MNRLAARVLAAALVTAMIGVGVEAAAAAAADGGSQSEQAAASACTVRLRAETNRPRAGRSWSWSISVSPARQTRISMAFLFLGRVVGRPNPSSATFRGTYRKTYTYPRRAVGVPLTFRVIVRASGCSRTVTMGVRARS